LATLGRGIFLSENYSARAVECPHCGHLDAHLIPACVACGHFTRELADVSAAIIPAAFAFDFANEMVNCRALRENGRK
jgi:Zn ribbon nucleic-acid-binding protein